MSDCNPTHRIQTLNSAPGESPVDESGRTAFLSKLVASTSEGYSIQVARSPGILCAECAEPTGAGPIGCLDDEPICDMCLLEGCHELGMVLAVIAVARAFASVDPRQVREQREALEELGASVRIYERLATKSGPLRRFRIPGQKGDSVSN